MAVKIKGVDYKKFMNDEKFWVGDMHYDDAVILVDGAPLDEMFERMEDIPDDMIISVSGGYIISDGYLYDKDKSYSFESAIKKWLKKQRMVTILVECDKDILDHVISAIKSSGGRILKG